MIPILVGCLAALLAVAIKESWFTHQPARRERHAVTETQSNPPQEPGTRFDSEIVSTKSPAPASLPDPPKQDLLLTGLVGSDSTASAFFLITEPGQPSVNFVLHAGEQNEWLHVLSIDPENGTVKATLKRPVVRIRNTGVEVILSLPLQGAKDQRR